MAKSQVLKALNVTLTETMSFEGCLEKASEAIAEKVGLKQAVAKSGAFILTQWAIQEAAQAIGIGSGFASLDLNGFVLAEIKSIVQDIQKKLDILLDAPLDAALNYCEAASRKLKMEDIQGTVDELRMMKERASTAFTNMT